MQSRFVRVILTLAVTLAATSPAFSKNNSNNSNDSLPQGKPFQMLADDIATLEDELRLEIETLQTQIDDLETDLSALEDRMDANEELDANQTALLDALETAQALLEDRMDQAESSIEALEQWRIYQASRIAILGRRISHIQREINEQGEDIDLLFRLHQRQQAYIGSLRRELVTLIRRGDSTLHRRISELEGEIDAVTRTANSTKAALARGCPIGSAIRQVRDYRWGTSRAVCERDDVAQAGTFETRTIGSRSRPLAPHRIATIRTYCPPGMAPTGGGHYTRPSSGLVLDAVVSRRSASGWEVTLVNQGRRPILVNGNVTCGRVI